VRKIQAGFAVLLLLLLLLRLLLLLQALHLPSNRHSRQILRAQSQGAA
jgi:hypothetical protein